MRFPALSGLKVPVPVSYDWRMVLQSFFVAVLASSLALYLVSRKIMSNVRAIGGGVLIGFGIAPLHYLDMLAMRMRADCHFNFMLVALSVGFAIAFSYSALRIAFYFRDATAEAMRKVGSAFFIASAICVMHYTGMAATTFIASGVQPDLAQSVSVSALGTTGIIIVTLLVLGLAMLSSLVDRRYEAQALQL